MTAGARQSGPDASSARPRARVAIVFTSTHRGRPRECNGRPRIERAGARHAERWVRLPLYVVNPPVRMSARTTAPSMPAWGAEPGTGGSVRAL